MKKVFVLFMLSLVLGICPALAQLNPGDLTFVGFNADGDDDMAMLTLADIPANTEIHYCDAEWDGSAMGADEGSLTWNSGGSVIPKGTVITFYGISDNTTAVSHGSITFHDAGGLSTGSEAIFLYHGTDSRTPTKMLAAIANSSSAFGTLENTGLIKGVTAIVLPEGTDIGVYNSTRTGIDANGFLVNIADNDNWIFQDTDDDDHNDSKAPDTPFDTTSFSISNTDVSAPIVAFANAKSLTSVELTFSEKVNATQANNVNNYGVSPNGSVTAVSYNNTLQKVTLTLSGLTAGKAFKVSAQNIQDNDNNTMANYTSGDMYFNDATPDLVITEIMYNAPSDNSDQLEFLEIYNNSGSAVEVGGLIVKDEGNFSFTLPEMTVNPNGFVLLATDKTSADAFYGVSFLDMPQGISNALGNGGELLQIVNSLGNVIESVEYDDKSPWPTEADGDGPSLELKDPSTDPNVGSNWQISTNLVGQSLGEDVFASPGSFVKNATVNLSFSENFTVVNEDIGSVNVAIDISSAPATSATVKVKVLDVSNATAGSDFTFTEQTLTFDAGNDTGWILTIPVTNIAGPQEDKFFVLQLTDETNSVLAGITEYVIYIQDTDKHAATDINELDMEHLGSYLVDGNGSAEIVAFDESSDRLFVLNSTQTKVEILDFSDPYNITNVKSVDMTSYGNGATSVTVFNGVAAATVDGVDFANGTVVFMDKDGNIKTSVEVGNLPDMVTFTHDGNKVLVANEGQPNADYSIDPEGSISIIDISGGVDAVDQSKVTTIGFTAFNADLAQLRQDGVRIYGVNATVASDMEPEYITVSEDNKKAWVSLQENNAIAVTDLENNQITDILPLGLKDYSLPENSLDACDDIEDDIVMTTLPVWGMYQPDAIANYTVNGVPYVITANEGDAREYDALEEEVRIGDSDYELDPTAFPNAEYLKSDFILGRLNATNATGDTDNDGDFDEIHVLGGRSFTIWNGNTGAKVFDSGDDFERIIREHPIWKEHFNTDNDEDDFKSRSDSKGPEPEGVAIGQIGDEFYAFITLERVGGVMVYKVTDPTAPVFSTYINTREMGEKGDLGPEGIIYINPETSPTDTAMVVVANEVSATISIFKLNEVTRTNSIEQKEAQTGIKAYPNPVSGGKVILSQPTAFKLYDQQGRLMVESEKAATIDVKHLSNGMYYLHIPGQNVTTLVLAH